MPGESKKISELESASSLNNGDLLELASVNALSETGYSSKKTTIGDVANKIATLNPQAQADWTEADTTDPSYIQNKPTLATVATSGSYNDLSDQPTIPAAQVNSDWNSSSGVSEILNKPTLGTSASKDVGVANGVASLDANGLVPTSQLPSFVDDVVEYANRSAFPATGETGKIYVALDTNLTYRWGGTEYVEISPSLALGETSSTAYAGDKGKANADAIAALQTTVSGLATVATTGDYDDLLDKPIIPTVNNATLTIQKNSTTVQTFTANASSDVTANITVPTTVAELSDASNYATTASLATVATTGAYSDLSGAPTLATVATSGSYNDLSSKPNIPDSLSGLTGDVNISSPTDGQVLKYDNATSKWVNGTGGGGGASALNDLTDVTITSATLASGQVLKYNGSAWVNDSGGGSSWTDLTGTLLAGQTSLTIQDVAITVNSTIDVYVDTFGVNPTNQVVTAGQIVLTFEAQANDLGVKVRVS